MIERAGKQIEMVCDGCAVSAAGVVCADDFDVLLAEARATGWTIRKLGGAWIHTCAACAARARRENGEGLF